jgi:hypothetical protein
MGAGLPFLYHGPQDSTVGDFLENYRAGTIVESEAPEALARGLREIIDNYSRMRDECRRAMQQCFDARMLRQRLLKAWLHHRQESSSPKAP